MLWHLDHIFVSCRPHRHRMGLCRYHFENHLLILGGSRRVANLLGAVANRPELAARSIVILTNQPVEQFRNRLQSALPPEARRLSVTYYFGERTNEAELRSCYVETASHLFIIGEDDESEHDALNVACWKLIRALRANSPQVAQCYLSLLHNATTNLFHMLPQEAHTSVETTIINHYESIAQQLLSGDSPYSAPYTLDRGIITADSDRYVHLVVVGMTPMGCAFATTAAHLCHYPNFNPESPHPLRTRITLIDPSAYLRTNQFKTAYPHIFTLSHSRYVTDANSWLQERPDSRFGDFLDIEWEFIKGSVEEDWVRVLLASYADDPKQVLTVAFCGSSPERNFAHAIHLPPQYYAVPDDEDVEPSAACRALPHPLVYVYQPTTGALLETVGTEVLRFRNLLPFGESVGSYDPLLTKPIAVAKRINYLYQREKSGKEFTSMPAAGALLDDLWQQLSYAEKMSHIHAANALPAHFRSLGIALPLSPQPFGDPDWVETLSRMEHARRNIEKLLAGFSPMPAAERDQLDAALLSDDPACRQEARIILNRNTNQRFIFKDIAPYARLTASAREDIRAIVRNLPLAV